MTSYRDNTIIEHESALKIAGSGRPVFPCRRDKSPYTPHGFKDATTDPDKVSAFWNKYRGAKIGMPTGKRSGVFVVDVDRLEALGELPGEMPETRKVRTPSGGLHYSFNYVEGITNRTGALPDGIDIRGDGGYVILPPSEGYSVESRAPVVDAPHWLLEALRDEPRKPSGPGWNRSEIPGDGEPIPEGSRNRTLFFHALDLKDQGCAHEDVLTHTLRANVTRCQPPLPEHEVVRIVKSAMRYPVRSGTPSPEVEEFVDQLEDEWWSTTWKGIAGKTDRDVVRVLIELTRRYGRLTEDGQALEVSASVRSVALAASTSYVTVSRGVTKRLANSGQAVKLDAGRGPREAATWRLFAPAQPVNTQHYGGASSEEMPCVNKLSTPERKRSWDLETPAFRWGGLVGKGRAGVLYSLEAYGPMTDEELADHLGITRVGNVRRYLRGYHDKRRGKVVHGLLDLGLVEERDGVFFIPDGYEERIDKVRNTRYAAHRKAKKRSREEERTVTVVDYGVQASEVEREAKDLEDYERHRLAHAKHLETLHEVESTSFDELAKVPPQAVQAERRGLCGRSTDDEEPDINTVAREVDQLVRQGMKRRFALEEVSRVLEERRKRLGGAA